MGTNTEYKKPEHLIYFFAHCENMNGMNYLPKNDFIEYAERMWEEREKLTEENKRLADSTKDLLEHYQTAKAYQYYVDCKIYFKSETVLTFYQWTLAGQPKE